jgi:hypothetical protein
MTTPFRAALAWAAFLAVAAVTAAEPEQLPQSVPTAQPAVQALDLAACRRLARERQPTLAAYVAGLAKAEANVAALDNLVFAELVQKDLPYRRRQAAHGLVIARTQMTLGLAETNYAVTRTYLMALFALEQKRVADEGVDTIVKVQDQLKNVDLALDSPQTKRLNVLLELARGRQAESESGHRRALAALAEAIGLDSPDGLAIVGDRLPDLDPAFDPRAVFDLSLRHRPELIMASEFAAGAALEVAAQAEAKGLTVQTFAAGADLHAEPLPPGPTDTEYRPRPLGPEMPTVLAGCREDRVAQARALSARSSAVVAKTRNLVALEARNALLRWEELATRRPRAARAEQLAAEQARGLREDFLKDPPKDSARFGTGLATVLEAGLLATLARLEHTHIRLDRLLLLALLERITAGTFSPGFE